jgi:hypothetical protein
MQQLLSLDRQVFEPPPRIGPRPRTRRALPCLQAEQWPPAEIYQELVGRSLRLPHVRPRQSRMAAPESQALCLPDDLAGGPGEAFIDGHEFCHLHPLPEGSIHLMLPLVPRCQAVEAGWAEPHPAALLGAMPQSLVMLYAPRNPRELHIVLQLISASYGYARWGAEHEMAKWQNRADHR